MSTDVPPPETDPLLDASWIEAVRQAFQQEEIALSLADKAADLAAIRRATQAHRPRYGMSHRDNHLRRWVVGAIATIGAATVAIAIGQNRSADRPTTLERAVATGNGQTASLILDDGTRILLAPHTSLRVGTSHTAHDRSRAVALIGVAQFHVMHTGETPFVVHTGNVSTRVLGTTFTVRHTNGQTRVSVTEGKVELSVHKQLAPRTLTLSAGWAGEASDSAMIGAPNGILVQDTAWVSGRLVFHLAPTRVVLDALTRWYGYDFRLADSSLAQKSITAGLSTSSSADALATLELVLNVDLSVDGNVVTLHPKHSVRPRRERHQGPIGPDSFMTEVGR